MTQPLKVINWFRNESCPLCRANRIRKVGDISYLRPTHFSTTEIELEFVPEYWRCAECGSFFIQNILPEGMAISLYSRGESNARWSTEPFVSRKPANQIHCLAKYFLPGRTVLDVGCNTGELLDYAKSLGCNTTGVEFSKSSRHVLEEKGHTACSVLNEIQHQFDVITAFDLVEHLYDVPTFLRQCQSLLKEDGALIILTGNPASLSARLSKARWWYIRYPEHIVFPSKRYYASCSGYELHEWVKTYASVGYRHRIGYSIARGIWDGTFNGLPSIGPDHVLLVMKRAS